MTTIKAAAEAARKAREWTARRDELMAKASECHSWREIGAACGMSHAGAKRAAERAREREDSLAGPLDKE